MNAADTKRAVDAMIEIARAAGVLLVEHFNRGVHWRGKGAFDVVTDADTACEELIVHLLRAIFPDDGIVAEEGTLREQQSAYRWLVDPLDGTKNFMRGNPCFSVTLALECNDEIVAGVVFDPMREEMFHAQAGCGSYCNGKRISVSRTERLEEALVTTGFPSARRHREIDPRFFHRVAMATQGLRRSGSTALDLAYVAAGRLDAFWDVGLAPWDVAAGLLLVSEAGGRCANFSGERNMPLQDDILAGNALLYDELTALYRETTAGARH